MKNFIVVLVGTAGCVKAHGFWSLKYLDQILVPLLAGCELGRLSSQCTRLYNACQAVDALGEIKAVDCAADRELLLTYSHIYLIPMTHSHQLLISKISKPLFSLG